MARILAFDGRAAERPPHSYRRLLELLYQASRFLDYDLEIWLDGPLHEDCQYLEPFARPYMSDFAPSAASVVWSPTPDWQDSTYIPSVATVCDINPLLPDGRLPWARWYRGKRFLKRMDNLFYHCNRIATDSVFACEGLCERFPADAEAIDIVPLFADERFQPMDTVSRNRLLAELGLAPDYVFFIGSFRRHKNWDGLIRAYARLPESLRAVHPLVMAGPIRREKQNAQRLIRRLKVEGRVHLLGETDERYIPALYNGAALFAFPSFMEGFGLPPLEAMQCGVPVVASNATSLPWVLGDAAKLIAPHDLTALTRSMEILLTDRDEHDRRRELGFAQSQKFSATRTAIAMQAVINKILK